MVAPFILKTTSDLGLTSSLEIDKERLEGLERGLNSRVSTLCADEAIELVGSHITVIDGMCRSFFHSMIL
jgi:hypothetical protein